jgi:hypothetical protein
MITIEDITTKDLVTSLRSTCCPACGEWKKVGNAFCYSHYKSLDSSLKRRIYNRIGHGYERAFMDAMNHLGATEFRRGI